MCFWSHFFQGDMFHSYQEKWQKPLNIALHAPCRQTVLLPNIECPFPAIRYILNRHIILSDPAGPQYNIIMSNGV